MNIQEIGNNAGIVWNALNEKPMTVKQLKTATKLKDAEIYLALGWLSREGKLSFEKTGKEDLVSLA